MRNIKCATHKEKNKRNPLIIAVICYLMIFCLCAKIVSCVDGEGCSNETVCVEHALGFLHILQTLDWFTEHFGCSDEHTEYEEHVGSEAIVYAEHSAVNHRGKLHLTQLLESFQE